MTQEIFRHIPMLDDERALEPASEGVELLAQYFPDQFETLATLMSSGTHVLNAYHNLHHEFGVVYWAHACAMNSNKHLKDGDMGALILGAAFHDHNHSGMRRPDKENVKRAIRFLSQVQLQTGIDHETIRRAEGVIRCTEFTDGKFPVKPSNFIKKCMRDADLMAIYSAEGRQLLFGLGHEMGRNLINDHEQFLEGSREFLMKAEMYTEFGNYVKDLYLEDCLLLLAHDLEKYRNQLMDIE
jgi:hypothetical protein